MARVSAASEGCRPCIIRRSIELRFETLSIIGSSCLAEARAAITAAPQAQGDKRREGAPRRLAPLTCNGIDLEGTVRTWREDEARYITGAFGSHRGAFRSSSSGI